MDSTISPHKVAAVQAALAAGLLGEDRPIGAFLHTDGMRDTVAALQHAFPAGTLHAFAAKAATIHRVLTLFRDAGMGCEVASPVELAAALRVGFDPATIVFDSPAKTRAEIDEALTRGVMLNVDNLQEFDRVRAWRGNRHSDSVIGLRINPQVGVGTIAAMSTATRTSKFGIALDDAGNREWLVQAYLEHPWLTCVHTHVGSQGCPLELIASGVKRAVELAEEVNASAGRRQVTTIDIGGGLPVNFASEEVNPTFEHYAGVLRDSVPVLFSGAYRVVTEFGRSIMAKNGFIAARVEYTKSTGERAIAITHAGAHTATRTVFMPEMWAIRVSVLDADGNPKEGGEILQDVAGPCCFAGDIIAHQRLLPPLEPGDWVLAHDTGAYYFSTPFYYNSLPPPAVHGYGTDAAGAVAFETVKRGQTLDEVLAIVG